MIPATNIMMMGAGGVINLVISVNTPEYNLFTAAGSPLTAVTVNLTINSGVYVYGSVTSGAGLHIPTFPAGSIINIFNNGLIVGKGGNGGGTVSDSQGLPGQQGGTAIKTVYAINITNNGSILGGGGGGGGGESTYWARGAPDFDTGTIVGSGGGGGQGFVGGTPGLFGPGSSFPYGGVLPSNGNAGALVGPGGGGPSGFSLVAFNGGTGGGPSTIYGGSGGTGAVWGTSGTNGGHVVGTPIAYQQIAPGVGPGGLGGYYIDGNAFATWLVNGTRIGLVI